MSTTTNLTAPFAQVRLCLGSPTNTEEEIHQLRVACKKLRAYLRLLPNTPERKIIDRGLRDLARRFAGQRDADVQRATLGRLMPSGELQALEDALGLTGSLDQPSTSDVRKEARQELGRIEALWSTLPALTAQQQNQAFVDQYRHCKQLGRKAMQGDDTLLHRWRKQEKYLLYQCELLECKSLRPQLKRFRKLAEDLGQHHDLVVLEHTLNQSDLRPKKLNTLRKRLAREKRHLRKRIHHHFRRGFRPAGKKLESWLGLKKS